MSETDLQLLARYTRNHAEDAFAELVRRHVDLVHSAALRQVRSTQLAEEVAQSVFTDLARNAHRLAPDTILTAWLYQVARRTAIDVVRREARRQLREQIATEMNAMNATTTDWTHIEPLLDEAMSALDETDRAAVLLRYFENKSLREVGQSLGTSGDAAQKRVGRAVERLREFFAKRGVTVGVGGLAVIISANAVQAAPIGLAATISSAATLVGTGIITTATATATKAVAMTTLQKTLITATLAVVAGAGIYEARQTSTLRTQLQNFQEQQAPLTEQIQQLQGERDEAINRLASITEEMAQMKNASAELLKLRGEVTRLRVAAQESAQSKAENPNDPTETAAKKMVARVKLLKVRLEQMPQMKIPELQFVAEENWLGIANASARLETDADYRWAFRQLRGSVEDKFAQMAQSALRKFAQANNGKSPTDLSQLQPYFDSPMDETILQRYEIVPARAIPSVKFGGDWLIAAKAPVDENDSREVIGPEGYGHPGETFYPPEVLHQKSGQ